MRYATILLAATLGGLAGMLAPWLLLRALAPWLGYGGYLMLLPGLAGSAAGCACGALCGVRLGIGWAPTGGTVRGAGVITVAVIVGAAVGALIPAAVGVALWAAAR
jgi:hypothetical protein